QLRDRLERPALRGRKLNQHRVLNSVELEESRDRSRRRGVDRSGDLPGRETELCRLAAVDAHVDLRLKIGDVRVRTRDAANLRQLVDCALRGLEQRSNVRPEDLDLQRVLTLRDLLLNDVDRSRADGGSGERAAQLCNLNALLRSRTRTVCRRGLARATAAQAGLPTLNELPGCLARRSVFERDGDHRLVRHLSRAAADAGAGSDRGPDVHDERVVRYGFFDAFANL